MKDLSSAQHPRKRFPIGCAGATAVATTLGIWISGLWVVELRGFNPDELQHIHHSWSLSKGLVPYVDFFEHHTPWLHIGLERVMRFFDVDRSVADGQDFLMLARKLMWLTTGTSLFLCFCLGRLWRDTLTGIIAAALLANSVHFFHKALEIRGDVPATALLLAATVALLLGFRARGARETLGLFTLSGLLLGSAIMFTQKSLMAVPGFMLALLWFVIRDEKPRRPLLGALFFTLGIGLPGMVTLAYFTSRDAGFAFIDSNFLMGLRWKLRIPPWALFWEIATQNPILVILCVVGFFQTLPAALHGSRFARGDFAILSIFVSLLIGAYIVPIAHRHYAMSFLPFGSLLAADALVRLVTRWTAPSRREGALALLLVLFSIYPSFEKRVFFRNTILPGLNDIAYVVNNTDPAEPAMDGFTGWGVFRPHAYFYFFLHNEIREMHEREDWLALEDKLARSELHPRFVFYDQHLRALPRSLRNFFQRHYVPLREGSRMLVRLPQSEDLPWSDEGRRWLVPQVEPLGTPYLLVENGWSQPERDGARSFRLGRGKRSRLLLPVAKPRDFDLAIHAALEFQHPVAVSLSVNGESLGTRQLEAGWGDYHFDVAGRFWQRGINEVLLTYSTTPYREDPGYRGPNAVIAAEYLELTDVSGSR